MIIYHDNWRDSNKFDDEWEKFTNILEDFKEEINKNNCSLTTSSDKEAYSISEITDKTYTFEYLLGESFYGSKGFGLSAIRDIKFETDLNKLVTSLEDIMICEELYKKFKKELKKNGFEYIE